MFTGIVEELGTVVRVEEQGDAIRLTIRAETVLEDVRLGDSIAVNGCCLTVAAIDRTPPGGAAPAAGTASAAGTAPAPSTPLAAGPAPAEQSVAVAWTADVMQETLDRTSLAGVRPGDRVNLERAVAAHQRLGGHLVQGHVDAVGTLVSRRPSEHWDVVEISLPTALDRYVVDKGAITVDGVSLTVVGSRPRDDGTAAFTVSLIPETLARTTLGLRRPGDRVNLETDVVARHLEKLVAGYLDRLAPSPVPDPKSPADAHPTEEHP